MRAAVITAFGGIDGLSVRALPLPSSGPGSALIEVEASAIGFADILTRRGIYPPDLTKPGIIPGGEVVGRVVSVGSSDQAELVGRRMFAFTGLGGHAEFVDVSVENLIPLSDQIDPVVVAGFGITAIVAQAALDRAGVGPGKTVLVRGAAGGLGLPAVRLAQLAGANVIATASSEDRAGHLRRLGAFAVVNRQGKLPSGSSPSIDIVIDPVGGPDVPTFLSMLQPNGVYVLLGAVNGRPGPEFGEALLANFFKSITFSTLSLHCVAMARRTAILMRLLEDYAAGRTEPDIDMIVSLDDIPFAHRRIEAGENYGRIVLRF